MDFYVRSNAKVEFRALISQHTGEEFERFFHKLMSLRYADFVPVGVHKGDQGADGLSLFSRRLYACYASSTSNARVILQKFDKDVTKAIEFRRDEFDTFVFVHNDTSGVLPDLSSRLAKAAKDHPGKHFEVMGDIRLWRECMQLSQQDMEELLDRELKVRELEYRIGLEELGPLLVELQQHRVSSPDSGPVPQPSQWKLDFNDVGDEYYDALKLAFTHTRKVQKYYDNSRNPYELEEVADGFHRYYLQLHGEDRSGVNIMEELEKYILGNGRPSLKPLLAAYVILAYFFEHCHIFENPPPGWSRT